ncbi:hypothetical protein NESM_000228000 [Novymonas esmeraldas]|uniref:Uncharacterized protein n=1 Tax=Novymonas esmeraldas TaxID=1808958 RepID=A0AAW0FAB9_9TRYP
MALQVAAHPRRAAWPARGGAVASLLFFVGALLLLLVLGAAPVEAATVTDLKNTIIAALQGINTGMTDYYSAMSATPAVQQQYCTTAISNQASGLSLTMESLSSPYGVMATAYGFLIYKDDFVFGPSISLIGASAWSNGTLTTAVQTGSNNILVPYQRNTIVYVTGIISNGNGNSNILPMARYMIVDGYLCMYSYMNVAALYTGTFSTPMAGLV